jgi:hypothetical protein
VARVGGFPYTPPSVQVKWGRSTRYALLFTPGLKMMMRAARRPVYVTRARLPWPVPVYLTGNTCEPRSNVNFLKEQTYLDLDINSTVSLPDSESIKLSISIYAIHALAAHSGVRDAEVRSCVRQMSSDKFACSTAQ